MAVPALLRVAQVMQDDRGFRARYEVTGFEPDISVIPATVGAAYAAIAALTGAMAAASNAKSVRTSFTYEFDIAQEPTSETGTYQLVQDKAICTFGDGMGLFSKLFIPAPRDALFLTTADNNLITVNPASSELTAIQAAAVGVLSSPAGGQLLTQFFGGQYKGNRSRRRRVLQGA